VELIIERETDYVLSLKKRQGYLENVHAILLLYISAGHLSQALANTKMEGLF